MIVYDARAEVGYASEPSGPSRYTVPKSDLEKHATKCAHCPAILVWSRTPGTPFRRNGQSVPLEVSTAVDVSAHVVSMEPHWGRCPGDKSRKPRK